jgi:hypothetical protein
LRHGPSRGQPFLEAKNSVDVRVGSEKPFGVFRQQESRLVRFGAAQDDAVVFDFRGTDRTAQMVVAGGRRYRRVV